MGVGDVGKSFLTVPGAANVQRLASNASRVPTLTLLTKAGFQLLDPSGKLIDGFGRIHATVRGDTRFDIELGRR